MTTISDRDRHKAQPIPTESSSKIWKEWDRTGWFFKRFSRHFVIPERTSPRFTKANATRLLKMIQAIHYMESVSASRHELVALKHKYLGESTSKWRDEWEQAGRDLDAIRLDFLLRAEDFIKWMEKTQ